MSLLRSICYCFVCVTVACRYFPHGCCTMHCTLPTTYTLSAARTSFSDFIPMGQKYMPCMLSRSNRLTILIPLKIFFSDKVSKMRNLLRIHGVRAASVCCLATFDKKMETFYYISQKHFVLKSLSMLI